MVYTCIKRRSDIEKECQILFQELDGSYDLVGEPELGYVSYLDFPEYPAWRWKVKVHEHGAPCMETWLVVDEEQQNVFLLDANNPSLSELFNHCEKGAFTHGCYTWKIDKDANGPFVKTYYDALLVDTKNEAVSEALLSYPDLSHEDILHVQLKVMPNMRLVWALYLEDRILLMSTIRSAMSEIYITEVGFDADLSNPVSGEDYLLFDLKRDDFISLKGMLAAHVNGKAFRPIPTSQAKIDFTKL